MKFPTMDEAVKYIEDVLRLEKIDSHYGSYSYGEKGQLRLIADHNGREVVVKPEIVGWYRYDDSKKRSGYYIASLAILKLFAEKHTVAAKALGNMVLSEVGEIVLNLEKKIDRDIFLALAYYGANAYIDDGKRAVCHVACQSRVPDEYLRSAVDEIAEYHQRSIETQG